MSEWGIPSLRPDRLASAIPLTTFGGGEVSNSAETLFLWRSVGTEKAAGGTLAFFLADDRLEPLWRHPARYASQFVACGIKAVVEADFSLWREMRIEELRFNVFRTRTVSRVFQGYGLSMLPNLNWSDESSFEFCFSGIPTRCPVAVTECRTAGANDEDRRAFLRGLSEGVKQVQPQHVVVYGGREHAF